MASSSLSSGTSHDLKFASGFMTQYHFSGKEAGSMPSGSFRHLRHVGSSHCAQVWSGSALKKRNHLD